MHPKSFVATTCNHMHVSASGHPKTLLIFPTFASDPGVVPQILEAAMGPMGLRHVWPFVLAPSGRSWQTHAWGCCWHVWALCHALGCTLPACFGMLTVLAATWAFRCHNWDFGGFLPSLGSRHANSVARCPPRVGGPKKGVHLPCPQPKWALKAQRGKACMAWVPKHHFPFKRVWRFLIWIPA